MPEQTVIWIINVAAHKEAKLPSIVASNFREFKSKPAPWWNFEVEMLRLLFCYQFIFKIKIKKLKNQSSTSWW